MDRETILKLTAEFSESSPTNYLSPPATTEAELAELKQRFLTNNFSRHNMPNGGDYDSLNRDKTPEYVGMRFFLPPILSVGRADDPLFEEIRKPQVVGPHHRLPTDWLPGAKSVISLFLPFTERVVTSNTRDPGMPSYEWLFTRVDGQQHLLATGELAADALRREGYQAVVPQTDDRYVMRTSPMQTELPIPTWSSNWSERHVAFVTGLGTFGRMTNFITRRGCCGRFISIVTDWETEPDTRDYTDVYDYCTGCGVCFENCPAGALSMAGKDIRKCSEYLRSISAKVAPRYGCGKCQSGLPCSVERP